MARSGSLDGSGLDPFGTGGGGGLSGFSILDPSRPAYLAYQKVQTAWQAGTATDADYLAAMKTYVDSTLPNTTTRFNAEASYANAVYTVDRNALQYKVQTGEKDITDLVAFDKAALEGMNPQSQEYMSRQQTLWNTQTKAFSDSETQITDQLNNGRMTWGQALVWYQDQLAGAQGNPDLVDALTSRVNTVKDRSIAEADQEIVDSWNEGKMTFSAFMGYAGLAVQESAGTDRAKTWQKNLDTATKQAVGQSLQYRYGLTKEYASLVQFDSSGPPAGSGGGYSDSVVSDGNGGWKTVRSYSGGSQSASYQDWVLKDQQAKARMDVIRAQVAALPGGWVSADDMISNLAAQQVDLVKGTPAWLTLQSQIDNYNSDKLAMQLLASEGIKVGYPAVGSETSTDPTVGPTEKAIPASNTQVSGGTSSGTGGSSGGGGGGGGSATSPATNSSGGVLYQYTGSASGASNIFGESDYSPTYVATGFPKNQSPNEWTSFYDAFTKAIKGNQGSWQDPITRIIYLIPSDPQKRLDMISAMDDSNINLMGYQRSVRAGTAGEVKAAKDWDDAKAQSQENMYYVLANPVIVPVSGQLVTPTPTQTEADSAKVFQTELNAGNPIVTYTPVTRDYHGAASFADNELSGGSSTSFDIPVNVIGAGADMIKRTQKIYNQDMSMAQAAMDRGDVSAAYAYFHQGQTLINDPKLLQAYQNYYEQVSVLTQKYPNIPPTVKADIDLIMSSSVTTPTTTDSGATVGPSAPKWMTDLTTSADTTKLGVYFDPTSNEHVLTYDQTGAPAMDGNSLAVNPNIVMIYKPTGGGDGKGTVVPTLKSTIGDASQYATTQMKTAGTNGWQVVSVPTVDAIVGYVSDPNNPGKNVPVMGKAIVTSVNGIDRTLVSDPFEPGKWIPVTSIDQTNVTFNLPPGATLTSVAGVGSTKSAQIAFSYGDGMQKTQYVAAWDASTHGYVMYGTNPDGSINFNAPVQPEDASAIWKGSGLTLNTAGLTSSQKTYTSIYKSMPDSQGAYLGSDADIQSLSTGAANAMWDSTVAAMNTQWEVDHWKPEVFSGLMAAKYGKISQLDRPDGAPVGPVGTPGQPDGSMGPAPATSSVPTVSAPYGTATQPTQPAYPAYPFSLYVAPFAASMTPEVAAATPAQIDAARRAAAIGAGQQAAGVAAAAALQQQQAADAAALAAARAEDVLPTGRMKDARVAPTPIPQLAKFGGKVKGL